MDFDEDDISAWDLEILSDNEDLPSWPTVELMRDGHDRQGGRGEDDRHIGQSREPMLAQGQEEQEEGQRRRAWVAHSAQQEDERRQRMRVTQHTQEQDQHMQRLKVEARKQEEEGRIQRMRLAQQEQQQHVQRQMAEARRQEEEERIQRMRLAQQEQQQHVQRQMAEAEEQRRARMAQEQGRLAQEEQRRVAQEEEEEKRRRIRLAQQMQMHKAEEEERARERAMDRERHMQMEREDARQMQRHQAEGEVRTRSDEIYVALMQAYAAGKTAVRTQIFAAAESFSDLGQLPERADDAAYRRVMNQFVELLKTDDERKETMDDEYARSVRKLKEGTPWEAIKARSASPPYCTPTPRGLVVGAFFDSNQDILLQLACDMCAVTHKSAVSMAACATAAFCMALAIEQVSPDRWPVMIVRQAAPVIRRWIAKYPFSKQEEYSLLLDAYFNSWVHPIPIPGGDRGGRGERADATEPACIHKAYQLILQQHQHKIAIPSFSSSSHSGTQTTHAIFTAWQSALFLMPSASQGIGSTSEFEHILHGLMASLHRIRSSIPSRSRQQYAPMMPHPVANFSRPPPPAITQDDARIRHPPLRPKPPPPPTATRGTPDKTGGSTREHLMRARESSITATYDRPVSRYAHPHPEATTTTATTSTRARLARSRVAKAAAGHRDTGDGEYTMDSVEESIMSIRDPRVAQQLKLVHGLLRTADKKTESRRQRR